MKRTTYVIAALSAAMIAGCSTEPSTTSDRHALHDDVNGALARMETEDPGLPTFLNRADGYVIFPTVGKGALIAGGAYGRGLVFENGGFVGYADISQATIGAQAGGQRFSEAIAFETPDSLQRFERGELAFDATASAVALKSGAAGSAKYDNGVAVFVEPVGGLMVEAAVGGQTFTYQPR
jgi:lipid-binding SYLF domain-containing protein